MLKKRICCVILIAICLFSLSACGVDFNAGRRPDANSNERWISEDPEMYFTWDDDRGGHYGELTVDGRTIEVLVPFDYGNGMHVYPYDPEAEHLLNGSDRLFKCSCTFSKNTVVATVTRDNQNVFGGELPTFVFRRYGLQEDGTFHPMGPDNSGVALLRHRLLDIRTLACICFVFSRLVFWFAF